MTAIESLAAEHGVRTRHQGGQLEVWEEASVLTDAGTVPASGWRPAPETVPAMLAWLGYRTTPGSMYETSTQGKGTT